MKMYKNRRCEVPLIPGLSDWRNSPSGWLYSQEKNLQKEITENSVWLRRNLGIVTKRKQKSTPAKNWTPII